VVKNIAGTMMAAKTINNRLNGKKSRDKLAMMAPTT